MDEIETLVKLIAGLPQLAVWALVGFYAYKVAVIGSLYGVIRFAIDKTHSWLTTPKHELKTVELRPMIDSMCITGTADSLIAQLNRLRGRRTGTVKSTYIHDCSITWLREAIDAKIESERSK